MIEEGFKWPRRYSVEGVRQVLARGAQAAEGQFSDRQPTEEGAFSGKGPQVGCPCCPSTSPRNPVQAGVV